MSWVLVQSELEFTSFHFDRVLCAACCAKSWVFICKLGHCCKPPSSEQTVTDSCLFCTTFNVLLILLQSATLW